MKAQEDNKHLKQAINHMIKPKNNESSKILKIKLNDVDEEPMNFTENIIQTVAEKETQAEEEFIINNPWRVVEISNLGITYENGSYVSTVTLKRDRLMNLEEREMARNRFKNMKQTRNVKRLRESWGF